MLHLKVFFFLKHDSLDLKNQQNELGICIRELYLYKYFVYQIKLLVGGKEIIHIRFHVIEKNSTNCTMHIDNIRCIVLKLHLIFI